MGKTPKADKKDKTVEAAGASEGEERDYDVLVKGVNAIASPLASKKLTKKLYKVSTPPAPPHVNAPRRSAPHSHTAATHSFAAATALPPDTFRRAPPHTRRRTRRRRSSGSTWRRAV
jgi:hypothetical protein